MSARKNLNMKYRILFILLVMSMPLLAQQKNTALYDWGDETNGQLFLPKDYSDHALMVSGGYVHSVRVDSSGLRSTGSDVDGQLGVPIFANDLLQIEASFGHTLILRADSTVRAWGLNDHGQTDVPGDLGKVKMVSAGDEHSIALLSDGTVRAWGGNTHGQTDIPVGLDSVILIEAGSFHNIALLADSTLVSWGRNDYNQSSVPMIDDEVVDVSAGELHTIALTKSGTVIGWGDSLLLNQLDIPQEIQGKVIDIEAGTHHTVALLNDSTISIWGSNTFSQSEHPEILVDRKVSSISGGYGHTSVIATNFAPDDVKLTDAAFFESTKETKDRVINLGLLISDPDSFDGVDIEILQNDLEGQLTFYHYLNSNDLFNVFHTDGENVNQSIFWEGSNLDFERKKEYVLRVKATDVGGLSIQKDLRIQVLNVNEEPFDIQLDSMSVGEGLPVGTFVGNLTAKDPDEGDSLSFRLSAGPLSSGNKNFKIEGDKLLTNKVLSFRKREEHSIRVSAVDQGGRFKDTTFVISVLNRNNKPTDIELSNNQLFATDDIGTEIGQFQTSDEDTEDSHVYKLVTEDSAAKAHFLVNGDRLKLAKQFISNQDQSFEIIVRSIDSGSPSDSLDKTITIHVRQGNKAPTDIFLSNPFLNRSLTVNRSFTEILTVDPDSGQSHNFELIDVEDSWNDVFDIQETYLILKRSIVGETVMVNGEDRTVEDTLWVNIKVTDNGLPKNESYTKLVPIIVREAEGNNPPSSVTLTPSEIQENSSLPTYIGDLTTIDPDGDTTFLYSLEGTNAARFFMKKYQLFALNAFNYENQQQVDLMVRVQDWTGADHLETLAISILDVQEIPDSVYVLNANVDEESPVGTPAGDVTEEWNGNPLNVSYRVLDFDGELSSRYAVEGGKLITRYKTDFETTPLDSVTLEVYNGGESSQAKVFIEINDVVEVIPSLVLDNSVINEGAPVGTKIGNFSLSTGATLRDFEISLFNDGGQNDNEAFTIANQALFVNDTFNFEVKSTYQVRLRTITDEVTLDTTMTITIEEEVLNNRPPVSLTLDRVQLDENNGVGEYIGRLLANDPDDSVLVYSLVSGAADNEDFTLKDDSLFALSVFDHERKSTLVLEASVSDRHGATFFKEIYLNIGDVNEMPEDITLSNAVASPDPNGSTFIGVLNTEDVDLGETHRYSLSGAGADYLTILNGNELWATLNLNYLSNNSVDVNITSTDAGGATYAETFTINVALPPTVLTTEFVVAEQADQGHVLGRIKVDGSGEHTFSIVGGNNDQAFNIDINNGALFVAKESAFDYNRSPGYVLSIQVENAFAISTIALVEVRIKPFDRPQLHPRSFSFPENIGNSEAIGEFGISGHENSAPPNWDLIAGNEDGVFAVASGVLYVADNSKVDFETKSNYTIEVQVTTETGYSVSGQYVVLVEEANDAPFNLEFSGDSIVQRQPVGTLVGKFSVEDQDPGDEHTFTLTQGAEFFGIQGNQLILNADLNFGEDRIITIEVEATDNGEPALSTRRRFNIAVPILLEPIIPTAFSPNGDQINDTWNIKNIELHGNVSVEVVSSSNLKVYSSNSYTEPWDGRYLGSVLPNGTYFYVITTSFSRYTGSLTILK